MPSGGQAAAPQTLPASPGAAPEPAASPHATTAGGTSGSGTGQSFQLPGGVTLDRVKSLAEAGDRQGCRDAAQTMRRAGADMPAPLLALAALDPNAAGRPAGAQ